MGDQSSGKSSVLEAVSGIPFPRSSGLVTKCATEISMSTGPKWKAEVSISGNNGKVVHLDCEAEITAKIEELSNELCGSKTFCSDEIIKIKVQAPGAPNLTIIDLPGIVRTSVEGQEKGVKDQVNELLDRYLREARTIILAVIPANIDIATVEMLERAAEVDPEGSRTMGVLTKPDLVDEGAEKGVLAVLENHTKPLTHGYYMLKNRSQGDSERGM